MKLKGMFRRAFTLLELLVVVGIIGILAALLLPAMSQAKVKARAIACRSNLHHVGLALRMYVDDNQVYPLAVNGWIPPEPDSWTHQLAPYLSIAAGRCTCPAFNGATQPWNVGRDPDPAAWLEGPGYGYNCFGTGAPRDPATGLANVLGLGYMGVDTRLLAPLPPISESRVKAPSEMFAVTDSFYSTDGHAPGSAVLASFPILNRVRSGLGVDFGWYGADTNFFIQQPPQHGKYFNVLHCDGHVSPIKLPDLFDVRKTAAHWNNDHQPHAETW